MLVTFRYRDLHRDTQQINRPRYTQTDIDNYLRDIREKYCLNEMHRTGLRKAGGWWLSINTLGNRGNDAAHIAFTLVTVCACEHKGLCKMAHRYSCSAFT